MLPEQCLFVDELIPFMKKRGKFKGRRRKVINIWWRSYIWGQLLNQFIGQNKVLVLISFRMKANSRSFPNIMEVSVEFGQKQISPSDTVAMG